VLRSPYTGATSPTIGRLALIAAVTFVSPGCSMSVPALGSEDAPAVTGSVREAVEVAKPLPDTLAYSDASKIGQAAVMALWQAESEVDGEWVNAATGSSGTVEGGGEAKGACRGFQTMVTSIGGVHRYSGEVCRPESGRAVVRIGTPAEAPTS